MNLEERLTFFGLLAAAAAIMGPVQRRALLLFVPKWLLPLSSLAALIFLIIRDTPLGVPPPFGWRLDMVTIRLILVHLCSRFQEPSSRGSFGGTPNCRAEIFLSWRSSCSQHFVRGSLTK